jgi:nickel superoxide dismutase
MKKMISVSLFLSLMVLFSSAAFSHCQVPCGIYDDEVRVKMISEHITTIEKAMKQVNELSKEDAQNFNQIVRWIQNKEKHAEELSDIVTYYFLTQRLKPAEMKDADSYKNYLKKLTLLHEMLVYAMKAKQTTELAHVEKLRSLLKDFRGVYFGPQAEEKK